MQIRKAMLKDIESLVDLFDQYRVWYHKESDKPRAREFLTARIQNKDSVIFVAENSQKSLAGFTQLYPQFSSTRMKRMWLLNDLFVHPDSRGQGISKMLINASKKLCQETDGCAVFLETDKDNLIGNQLYPGIGFKLNQGSNFYEWSNS